MTLWKDFDPINRRMPKGWKNPLREPLFRVVVEARGEKEPIAVTPGMKRELADMFADAVKKQIVTGFEQNWSNPTVVLCHV